MDCLEWAFIFRLYIGRLSEQYHPSKPSRQSVKAAFSFCNGKVPRPARDAGRVQPHRLPLIWPGLACDTVTLHWQPGSAGKQTERRETEKAQSIPCNGNLRGPENTTSMTDKAYKAYKAYVWSYGLFDTRYRYSNQKGSRGHMSLPKPQS